MRQQEWEGGCTGCRKGPSQAWGRGKRGPRPQSLSHALCYFPGLIFVLHNRSSGRVEVLWLSPSLEQFSSSELLDRDQGDPAPIPACGLRTSAPPSAGPQAL